MIKVRAWLPVVAFMLSAPSVGQAATVTNTWVFDFTPCSSNCGFRNGGGTVINSRTFSSNTIDGQTKTVTATALFVDGLTNPSLSGNPNGKSTTLANQVKGASLKANTGSGTTKAGLAVNNTDSGLGIGNPVDGPQTDGHENSTGGQHAIDNYDWTTSGSGGIDYSGSHATDFLLLDFGEVMSLSSFRLGWVGNSNTDVDFFIGTDLPFASGFTNANGTSNGTTIASLLSNGWQQVSKTNLSTGTQSFSASEQHSGRYVLVSGALGGYNDAFKFDKITMTTTTSNPTPGTMALLGIGMAAVAWSRRSKRGSNSAVK